MEKIKAFTIKNKDAILIIATIIISCIIYYNYLIGHFAAETYAVAQDYKYYAINAYLADGRIFSSILLLFANLVNMPILNLMSISVFIGICIAVIAVWKLKDTIVKLIDVSKKQELIIWFICYSVIFNFMMVEILYFPESCIMSLSVLFNIIAASFFINKKYIKTGIFLLIGIFCYQATTGFFIVCCCLFSIIKYKKLGKDIVKDIIKMGVIAIITALINLLFIKGITNILQLNQNKVFELGIETIINNIIIIFKSMFYILSENCGLFPKYLLLIFIQIILILGIIEMFKQKDEKILINIFFILVITILSSFAIFVIQTGSMYTGRVHFCIGSIIGIELMYIYCTTNIKNSKITKYVFYILLCFYIMINIVNAIQLTNEHQIVNRLEKEECTRIEEIILQYEKENNKKINKVVPVVVLNQKEKGFFDETKRRTIVTYNNTRHYYGYTCVLNYYLNRKLNGISPNKSDRLKYEEYIKNSKLNYGDIICIDDILYIPQYIF